MKTKIYTTFCIILLAVCFATNANAQTGNTGFGTSQPGSKLTINGSFAATYNNTTATTYTMSTSDYYLSWNGSATGTVTLPAALAVGSGNFLGRVYHVKNVSTSNSVTVAAAGSELIDNQSGAGVANINLPPGYYAMLISKGTTSGTTWEVSITGSAASISTVGPVLRVSFNSFSNAVAAPSPTPVQLTIQGTTFNGIAGTTIGANSITLPAGTYRLEFTSFTNLGYPAGSGQQEGQATYTMYINGVSYQVLGSMGYQTAAQNFGASGNCFGSAIFTLSSPGIITYILNWAVYVGSGSIITVPGGASSVSTIQKLQ